MSAALDSNPSRGERVDLLLAQCAEAAPRRPVFERLRDKLGGELARLLVFALAPQRRSARRG